MQKREKYHVKKEKPEKECWILRMYPQSLEKCETMKKYDETSPGERVCLECGDRIGYGRSDRKFCCDACKNRFHNRHAMSSRRYRQKVCLALDRNYDILESLRKTSIRSIGMADLENMGFNRNYFTSYVKRSTREMFMCYDIKYSVFHGKVVTISKLDSGTV